MAMRMTRRLVSSLIPSFWFRARDTAVTEMWASLAISLRVMFPLIPLPSLTGLDLV
jgi:hypothetical protein